MMKNQEVPVSLMDDKRRGTAALQLQVARRDVL